MPERRRAQRRRDFLRRVSRLNMNYPYKLWLQLRGQSNDSCGWATLHERQRKEAPEYTASRLFDRVAQVRPGVFLVEIKT